MADLLIRDVDKATIKKLKARAVENRRSLQSEVKDILERSALEVSFKELRRRADEFSNRFQGRRFTDSVDFIHEDRDR